MNLLNAIWFMAEQGLMWLGSGILVVLAMTFVLLPAGAALDMVIFGRSWRTFNWARAHKVLYWGLCAPSLAVIIGSLIYG